MKRCTMIYAHTARTIKTLFENSIWRRLSMKVEPKVSAHGTNYESFTLKEIKKTRTEHENGPA